MIIPNGTYSIQTQQGGGTDYLGRPMESKAQWSEPKSCRILTNTANRLAQYQDGTFNAATYTMTIDGLQTFPYKFVRLERQGEQLGEFKVASAEQLDVVNATKVTLTR